MSSHSVSALWSDHRREPFPASARGREVKGIDLVLLDSLAAGCIDSMISGGLVDTSKIALLQDLSRQIGMVLPHLSADEQAHFARLRVIATAALSSRGA